MQLAAKVQTPLPGREAPVRSRALSAAMLASGNVLNALASVVSLAVLVRALPVSAYATYRQVVLTYAFVTPLLALGLPEALYFFLPGAGPRARTMVIENLVVLGASGALFGLFVLAGGSHILSRFFGNANADEGLLIMAAYPVTTLLASSVNACLIARGHVLRAAMYGVASRLFILVSVIGSCIVWRTAEAALAASVVASALVLPIGIQLMLSACRGVASASLRGIGEQVRYAVPIGITSMIAVTASLLDKVVVAGSSSAEDFAIYVNGAMEIPLVGVLTGSAMVVLLPEMSRLCKEGRPLEALAMWQRAATKTALGLFPAFWFLLALAPDFIAVLYSPRYLASVSVFRICLLLLPLRIVYFGAVLMAARRGKILLLTSSVGLVSNLALSILLVRLVGYHGAAWASVASLYVFQIAMTLHFIGRTYRVAYLRVLPYAALAKIAGAAAVAGIVVLPRFAGIPGGAVSSLLVYGLAYAGAVLVLFRVGRLLDVRVLWVNARTAVALRLAQMRGDVGT